MSYKIIYQNDAAAVQRIRQKEVYERKRELVLLGERVVLVTLGFDLNVRHPYGPLVGAFKKFKVAQRALAQVAWSFVNDGLKTSLCLQFQPRQIAAGALFLAAMRPEIKLPTNGKNAWWQEFGVTLRQLEDYCNQMLHLYEHNTPAFQASGAGGRNAGGRGPPSRAPANVQNVTNYSSSHGGATLKASSLKPAPLRPGPDEQRTGNHTGPPRITQTRNDEYGSSDSIPGPCREDGIGDLQRHEREAIPPQGNSGETRNKTEFGIGGHGKDHQEGNFVRIEPMNAEELKDKYRGRNLSDRDAKVGQSPQVAIIKLDREKLKAAFARRKALGDITSKIDPMDELERELEDVGVLGDRRLRAK